MLNVAVIAIVFGLIFVSELPDKTTVAGAGAGHQVPVALGVYRHGGGLLTHLAIAVVAGSMISLLPRRPVEVIVAVLFALGAVLVRREGLTDERAEEEQTEETELETAPGSVGFWKVAGWGYAVLGLWAVGLLAILSGKTLLKVLLPIKWIARIAALVMLVFKVIAVDSDVCAYGIALFRGSPHVGSQLTQPGLVRLRRS